MSFTHSHVFPCDYLISKTKQNKTARIAFIFIKQYDSPRFRELIYTAYTYKQLWLSAINTIKIWSAHM